MVARRDLTDWSVSFFIFHLYVKHCVPLEPSRQSLAITHGISAHVSEHAYCVYR